MAERIPEAGETVGRWTVERWVAAGAHCDVLLVHRTDLVQLHGALKWARTVADRAGLTAEADVLDQLDHHGIVRLLERGPDERWFVQSWADGRPPDALGDTTPGQAAHIAEQLARALAHAHAHGLAHGDIKPANVRVDAQGRLSLLDFGSAAPSNTPTPLASTPRYAPPEWFGHIVHDPRAADIYALGVVLCEMLSGAPAFGAKGLRDLAEIKRSGPLLVDDVPTELAHLIARCTALEPSDRPRAREVADTLQSVAERPDALYSVTDEPHGEAPARTLEPTTDARDRYTVVHQLGRGGMGVVAKAWDERLARYVALKRPHPGQVDEQRFLREARLAAGLNHNGLVRVFDVDSDQRGPYFTMEYVDGQTLRDTLVDGPMEPRAAAKIIAQTADALACAHAAGLAHRDVKCSNVMIDRAGHARLLDFGLARAINTDVSLTADGQLVGTPAYMSPEQLRGEAITNAVDIYALGAVLYECLTAVPPHGSDLLRRALRDEIVPVRVHRPSVSDDLQAICAWCLRGDPSQRPSALELAADLRRYVAGEPVLARTPGLPTRSWRWAQRRPATIAAGLGALAAIGVGTAWTAQIARTAAAESQRQSSADQRWAQLKEQLPTMTELTADEALQAFVHDGSTERTRARVQALVWRADRRTAAEKHELALESIADAWLQARSEDWPWVLPALSSTLQSLGRFDDAARVTSAAQGLPADALPGVRQQELLLQRRFDDAADVSGPLRRLARALAPATRTQAPASHFYFVGDALGDEAPELMTSNTTERVLLDGTPELTELHRFASSDRQVWIPMAGGILASGPSSTWRTWDGAEWSVRDEVTDLSAYVGVAHEGQHVLVQQAGPTRVVQWVPGQPALDLWDGLKYVPGEVEGLAFGDLDQDGVDELVINPGHWGAFELWVLERGPQSALTYQPIDHLPVGYTPSIHVLRRADSADQIAVMIGQQYGSRRVFPTGSPYGLAQGLHLYSLTDRRLKHERHLAQTSGCVRTFAGDLDGDGDDELIGDCAQATVILGRAPGAVARIPKTQPLAVVDLDADGDDELVLVDLVTGVVWTLGSGSARLPTTPASENTDKSTGSAALDRIRSLATIGLRRQAARQMLSLAPTLQDADTWTAWAGEQLVQDGRIVDAERALRTHDGPQSRARLRELLVFEGRLHDAAELGADVPAAPHHRFTFDGPSVPPQVQIEQAGTVHLDPGGKGLILSATDSASPMVRVDLDRPQALRVKAQMVLNRLDWSGSFRLSLLDPDDEPIALVDIEGWGGAGATHLTTHLAGPTGRTTLPGPLVTQRAIHISISLEQTDDHWLLRLDRDGERHELRTVSDGPIAGPVHVQLSAGPLMSAPSALAEVTLQSLTIEGARVSTPIDDGPALRHLAENHPDEALASGIDDPRTRLVALADAGRSTEARALLTELVAPGPPPWLPHLMRTGRYDWDDTLAAALGPEWLELWTLGHVMQVYSHGPNASADAALIDGLQGIETWDLGANSDRDRLVLDRAKALRRAGQLPQARRLTRAFLTIPATTERAEARVRGHVELAVIEAHASDLDAALHAARLALDDSPLPERTRYALRRAVRGLSVEDDPRWIAVVGEQRPR